jgi:hypothetical protein
MRLAFLVLAMPLASWEGTSSAKVLGMVIYERAGRPHPPGVLPACPGARAHRKAG